MTRSLLVALLGFASISTTVSQGCRGFFLKAKARPNTKRGILAGKGQAMLSEESRDYGRLRGPPLPGFGAVFQAKSMLECQKRIFRSHIGSSHTLSVHPYELKPHAWVKCNKWLVALESEL